MKRIREAIFEDFPGPFNTNLASMRIAHYVVENLWDRIEHAMNLHDISVEGDESQNSWIMGMK